jgi:hypothetical protein
MVMVNLNYEYEFEKKILSAAKVVKNKSFSAAKLKSF